MADRLQELQRQRALVQEQLAWLDREIATLQGTTGIANTPAGRTSLPPAAPLTPTPPSPLAPRATDARAAELAAEEILARYKPESDSLQGSVKRGCFLYFFLALALLGLGVIGLYLLRTRT